MTGESAGELKLRLRGLGLSDRAISAAWPRWWSDDAEASASARAELRFGLARRLGLDPTSLLDDREEPRFVWHEAARFKHLSGESEQERAGITSFGRALASVLVSAAPRPSGSIAGTTARTLRQAVLAERPFVALGDLVSLAWAVGIPVVHLRVFPWRQKRMAAMTARVRERWAIMLGKDSSYPATIAFYLAHELGHIALEHVGTDEQIVDLEEEVPALAEDDDEERAADAFALELLTGEPRPTVLPTGPGRVHGRALAHAALQSAEGLEIEPGTLALAFGYSTGDWRTANAALSQIYGSRQPVWIDINAIAWQQLDLDELTPDALDFVNAVLGQTDE